MSRCDVEHPQRALETVEDNLSEGGVLVRRDLERIFAFRRDELRRIFHAVTTVLTAQLPRCMTPFNNDDLLGCAGSSYER